MDSSPIIPSTTQSQSSPIQPNRSLLIFLICLVSVFILVFLGLLFVFNQRNRPDSLVIYDQPQNIGITIKQLSLKKGGFLIVTPSVSPADAIFRSEFLSSGNYTDFDIPNFMLPGTSSQPVSTMRAFLYEDSNNSKQFEYSDKPLTNFFGKPISVQFKLENNTAASLSCRNGLVDDFNEMSINSSLWYSYFWNQQKGGSLVQIAKGNALTNSSTTLYSKDKFTGNLAVEANIASFTVDHGPDADYQATAELTLFTEIDRIISVKWIKSFGQSYLTPNISKFKPALQERYPIIGEGPLRLKIVRTGTTAQIYLAIENSDYQQLWDLPNIATDDLHVGFESYDFSPIPTLVTSVLNSLSISCPSL